MDITIWVIFTAVIVGVFMWVYKSVHARGAQDAANDINKQVEEELNEITDYVKEVRDQKLSDNDILNNT